MTDAPIVSSQYVHKHKSSQTNSRYLLVYVLSPPSRVFIVFAHNAVGVRLRQRNERTLTDSYCANEMSRGQANGLPRFQYSPRHSDQ